MRKQIVINKVSNFKRNVETNKELIVMITNIYK